MRKIGPLLAVLGCIMFISLPAVAGKGDNGNGNGNGKSNGKSSNANTVKSGNYSKSVNEKKVDKSNKYDNDDDYNWDNFRKQARDLGYRDYKPLPPGVAKNLAKGKPLPPGIAKKSVPANLARTLPYHAGREWNIVGNDLVSVVSSTGMVASVIRGAL